MDWPAAGVILWGGGARREAPPGGRFFPGDPASPCAAKKRRKNQEGKITDPSSSSCFYTKDASARAAEGPRPQPTEAGGRAPAPCAEGLPAQSYWVSLLAVQEPHPENKRYKKKKCVIVSRDPLYKCTMHNERRTGSKETSPSAPYWRIKMIFGPFKNRRSAVRRKLALLEKRQTQRHYDRAVLIAAVEDLDIFFADDEMREEYAPGIAAVRGKAIDADDMLRMLSVISQ